MVYVKHINRNIPHHVKVNPRGHDELVSWCFEPSQPQRITSGLWMMMIMMMIKTTTFGLYSVHFLVQLHVQYAILSRSHKTWVLTVYGVLAQSQVLGSHCVRCSAQSQDLGSHCVRCSAQSQVLGSHCIRCSAQSQDLGSHCVHCFALSHHMGSHTVHSIFRWATRLGFAHCT